jgi:hypothetical protein
MQSPNLVYKINLTYQIAPVPFTANAISSVANASGSNTVYTGTFIPSLFVTGQSAMVTGFTHAVNNGTFVIVSVTATTLTLANSSGVSETTAASAINASWYPIPDYYSDIYNWLFLSESLAVTDDPRSQLYRQRGVAAFIAKSDGLTDMQRNAFTQQWGNYSREGQSMALKVQRGAQAGSI